MREKRECKIVQDLLPNYIENLTNVETNNYIENHIKECPECEEMFKNMKKELELNLKNNDKKEVKYIKKFNKKIKLLRNILLVIIILFIIIVGRRAIILTNLYNKGEIEKNKGNYYAKIETYSEEVITITEIFYKDENSFITTTTYRGKNSSDIKVIMKETFYKSKEESFTLTETEKEKIVRNVDNKLSIAPETYIYKHFLTNVFISMSSNVNKVKLGNKDCYLIKRDNIEVFIDAETGLAIKKIDNTSNATVDYKYEYGTVIKDTDIVKPDIEGYVIEN